MKIYKNPVSASQFSGKKDVPKRNYSAEKHVQQKRTAAYETVQNYDTGSSFNIKTDSCILVKKNSKIFVEIIKITEKYFCGGQMSFYC